MNEKLKPCPIDGTTDIRVGGKGREEGASAHCQKCGLTLRAATIDAVVKLWNTWGGGR